MTTSGRPYEGIVVAHTHWDREWYATFEQFRIRLVRLIDQVLDLLESNPRFRYFTLDGQTIVLEDYLAIRPENEDRLRALVQSGRLLIGPWYVLPDEFLVSAEALVRNLMLGAKVGGAFGAVMAVGYVPDPFGHVAQLPQILAGFGIDSFIFSRGLGDEGEQLGSEFLWQAPDGTVVLAVHQIGWDQRSTGYLNASSLGYPSPWVPRTGGPDFALAVAQLAELAAKLRRYARTPYLLLNNGCDHLAPQPELPQLLDQANAVLADVSFVQGTFPQYVASVRRLASSLPTSRGELRGSRYAPLLSGVLSTRMHLKQENERTQTLLSHWAEPFSAIASLEGADYPVAFLWRAWRYLLWNHPHDSICGCSIDQVHAEMLPRFAHAQQIGEHFVAASLAFIAARADRSSLPAGALPIAVWNPLGHPRADVVRLTLDLPSEWAGASAFAVVAPGGGRLPCQILGRQRYQPLQGHDSPLVEKITLAFGAASVPALGYRIYGLLPAFGRETDPTPNPLREDAACCTPPAPVPLQAELAPSPAQGGEGVRSDLPTIENAFYKIVAHPDATLTITHKPTGHTVSGALLLVDDADTGDEYTFSPLVGDAPRTSRDAAATARPTCAGPAVSTIEIALDWSLPAALAPDRQARSATLVKYPVHLSVSLYEGVERVDVQVAIENNAADHRLRLLLPTGIAAQRVTAAGHFTVLDRAVALPATVDWAERPSPTNHHAGFVDVSDGRRGVALIANGLPEYEAIADGTGLTLALTLLRCVGWLSRDDIAGRPGHAGPGLPTPDAQCPGSYTFRCALYIHAGDWLRGSTYRRALEHNVPLRATPLGAVPESPRPTGTLPPALGFLTVEGEGLVLSALKRSEDGRWLVARVYNAAAETVAGRLRCYRPIAEAALLRLDERELGPITPDADGTLPFDARGGKILTFGLRLTAAT